MWAIVVIVFPCVYLVCTQYYLHSIFVIATSRIGFDSDDRKSLSLDSAIETTPILPYTGVVFPFFGSVLF